MEGEVIIKELIASLEEAMELAGDMFPNRCYRRAIKDAEEFLGRKHLYQEALDLWGAEFEVDMMIEECAELTSALQKLKRGRPADAAEELADVEIMSEQLRLIFDPMLIEHEKEAKLARLRAEIAESRAART